MKHHLIALAPEIIETHELHPAPLRFDQKRLLKYIAESDTQTRELFVDKRGREVWGEDKAADYRAYFKAHREQLFGDYSLPRIYWPVAFRDQWMNGWKPQKGYPWLEWYWAFLGQKYADFPADLEWKVLLYQIWKERLKIWRGQWCEYFHEVYPEAPAGMLRVTAAQRNIYNLWRIIAYNKGLEALEEHWLVDAFEAWDIREQVGAGYFEE